MELAYELNKIPKKNNPYTLRLIAVYWIMLKTIAKYANIMGIASIIKKLIEKLIVNMVCILTYLKLSLRFLNDNS